MIVLGLQRHEATTDLTPTPSFKNTIDKWWGVFVASFLRMTREAGENRSGPRSFILM